MSDQTHYAGCWEDPRHHACALREIERLRLAQAENQKLWGWYETELKRAGALQRKLNKAETEKEALGRE
jgi:hypothetical protein